MKTTRTYLKGCDWCNATGFVRNSNPSFSGNTSLTELCPVCNGNKTITVTEVAEMPTEEERDEAAMDCIRNDDMLYELEIFKAGWDACRNRMKEAKTKTVEMPTDVAKTETDTGHLIDMPEVVEYDKEVERRIASRMPTEEDRQFCEEIKVIAISNYAADIPRLIIRLFRTRMSKPNTGGEG